MKKLTCFKAYDIRGKLGEELNEDIAWRIGRAYGEFLKPKTIVLGGDVRLTSETLKLALAKGLQDAGVDVLDIGMSGTEEIYFATFHLGVDGGIEVTASHNPKQWNALKLLNEKGEFLNAAEGAEVLRIAAAEDFEFADVDHLGKVIPNATYKQKHIESVLNLDLVDVEAIKAANFRVAIDCVNSVGGIVIPDLLYALGVKEIFKLHCAPHGNFSHNPEPIPENLTEISDLMGHAKADVGFVVDPDVDRLAIICENGEMFNEEYTLVAVSDYVLSHTPGNTVSNLSSSRALRDVTRAHGCEYNAAAVGEVNVVAKMKATNAVIGGEGNGGVIYPASHYGRDALVGIALFLTHLAKKKMKTSELKASYPPYFISKQKVQLTPEIDVDAILAKVKEKFSQYDITDIDGVKIDFPDKWVHLRKSNTEPIIRIYSEAHTMEEAEELGGQLIQIINEMCK